MKNISYLYFVVFCSFIIIIACQYKTSSSHATPQTAEEVAHAIERAIHKSDWDNTKWVHWVFGGRREHLWDRERGFAEVVWDNNRVLINVNSQDGIVYLDGESINGTRRDSLLKKGWSAFINDAFWLNAPAKLFDDGTQLSLVDRDGEECLKVDYTTGGVTPGDSYVWHYDENFLPTAWEMYVSVISTPGVVSSWEEWISLASGAKIATAHRRGDRLSEMKEVKSGNSFLDFGRDEDPFLELQPKLARQKPE